MTSIRNQASELTSQDLVQDATNMPAEYYTLLTEYLGALELAQSSRPQLTKFQHVIEETLRWLNGKIEAHIARPDEVETFRHLMRNMICGVREGHCQSISSLDALEERVAGWRPSQARDLNKFERSEDAEQRTPSAADTFISRKGPAMLRACSIRPRYVPQSRLVSAQSRARVLGSMTKSYGAPL